MFTLVSDQTDENTAIGVHRKRLFSLTTSFLDVQAWHDSTSGDFSVITAPNYEHLAELKVGTDKAGAPNAERFNAISLGDFPTLEIIYDVVSNLEEWYKGVLKNRGAGHRMLVEEGNSYHMVRTDKASPTRFGQAIIQARNLQAFDMMERNFAPDHQTIVGKIMPVFVHALGLAQYEIGHDLSKDGYSEVEFLFEEIGAFKFYKPLRPGGAVYLERFTYRDGDYYRSYEGEATGDVLKKAVLGWLVDAAREHGTLPRQDFEEYMGELAYDIRRSWIDPRKPPVVPMKTEPLGKVIPLFGNRHLS